MLYRRASTFSISDDLLSRKPEQVQYEIMSLAQLKKLAEEQQKLLNEKQNGLREKENQLKVLYKKYQDQVDAENRLRKTKVLLKQQEERIRHLRELRGLVEHEKNRSGTLSTELDSVKQLLQAKKDELRKVTDKVEILSQHVGRFVQQKEDFRNVHAVNPSAEFQLPLWPDETSEISQSIAAKQRQLQEVQSRINYVNERLSRAAKSNNKQRIPARENHNGHIPTTGNTSKLNGDLQRFSFIESGKHVLLNGLATHAKSNERSSLKTKAVSAEKPVREDNAVEGRNRSQHFNSLQQVSKQNNNLAKRLSNLDDAASPVAADKLIVHADESSSNISYAADGDETDQRLPANHIPILSTSPSNNGSQRSSSSGRGEKNTLVESHAIPVQPAVADKDPVSSTSTSTADVSLPSSSNGSTLHGGDDADNEEEVAKENEQQQMTPSKLIRRVSFDPLALLLDAALEGELELVRKTVGQVADASAPNDEGITALHNAICTGHYDVVKFLIEFGCDVNVQDADGWSPLHCAASCTHTEMLKLLVENGACVFATTFTDNETPSQKCEEGEEGYEASFKYLTQIETSLGIANDAVVYAAYDFEAHNDDELSFRCNDKINVLHRDGSKAEREWWWAKIIGNAKAGAAGDDKENAPPANASNREGFVPRNMLSLYPVVRAQKSRNKVSDDDD